MDSVRFNSHRKAWFIDYIDATGRGIRQSIGAGDENRRLARKALAHRERPRRSSESTDCR